MLFLGVKSCFLDPLIQTPHANMRAQFTSRRGVMTVRTYTSTVQLSGARVSAVLHMALSVKTRLAADPESTSPCIFLIFPFFIFFEDSAERRVTNSAGLFRAGGAPLARRLVFCVVGASSTCPVSWTPEEASRAGF